MIVLTNIEVQKMNVDGCSGRVRMSREKSCMAYDRSALLIAYSRPQFWVYPFLDSICVEVLCRIKNNIQKLCHIFESL